MDGDDVLPRLEFPAQVADVRVDRPLVTFEGDAAHRVEQLGASENAPGLAHHGRQKFELGHGEHHAPVRQVDLVARPVQGQVARPDHFAGRIPAGASQDRAHAHHQFARAERFGDVIICPQFQADELVRLLDAGREHDDGHIAFMSQGTAKVQPVHAGQHQVQHDQVRLLGARQRQPLQPVPGGDDIKTGGVQIVAADLDDLGFVIDDENFLGHCLSDYGADG